MKNNSVLIKWKDQLNRQPDDNMGKKSWQQTIRDKRDSERRMGTTDCEAGQYLTTELDDDDDVTAIEFDTGYKLINCYYRILFVTISSILCDNILWFVRILSI